MIQLHNWLIKPCYCRNIYANYKHYIFENLSWFLCLIACEIQLISLVTLVTWSHLGTWDILDCTNLGSAVQNMKVMFSHDRPQLNVWLLLFDLSQISLFLACPMWKGLIFRSHLVCVVVFIRYPVYHKLGLSALELDR